eukprot:766441-Hanusia_phi.AAC.3
MMQKDSVGPGAAHAEEDEEEETRRRRDEEEARRRRGGDVEGRREDVREPWRDRERVRRAQGAFRGKTVGGFPDGMLVIVFSRMVRASKKHNDADVMIRVESSLKSLQAEIDECNMIQHFFKHSLASNVLGNLWKVDIGLLG